MRNCSTIATRNSMTMTKVMTMTHCSMTIARNLTKNCSMTRSTRKNFPMTRWTMTRWTRKNSTRCCSMTKIATRRTMIPMTRKKIKSTRSMKKYCSTMTRSMTRMTRCSIENFLISQSSEYNLS